MPPTESDIDEDIVVLIDKSNLNPKQKQEIKDYIVQQMTDAWEVRMGDDL